MDAACMGAWHGNLSTSPWDSGGVPRTHAPLVSEHHPSEPISPSQSPNLVTASPSPHCLGRQQVQGALEEAVGGKYGLDQPPRYSLGPCGCKGRGQGFSKAPLT